MKYGYGRVSTHGQAKNGNSLEAQENRLREEGCEKIYLDVWTGKTEDRPEFQKLLSVLKAGDTLVVTKLDRLNRGSADKAIQLVKELFNQGIRIHILNMGLIENTPTGRLILTIFSGFAEFERDLIVERTQEGKAIARQRPDFRDGRPNKFSKKHVENALKMLETNSYKEVEEATGISVSTLTRAKRKAKSKEATAE